MTQRSIYTSALCVGMLGISPYCMAELNWNGFLSVGGGFSDVDEGQTLYGYEEDFTFKQDTTLGLQVRSQISDKLSATGQMVARGTEDYNVKAAWAYISYEANDHATFRIGRFRTPFYLYSDFLEVGYAYHWIAPPEEVYDVPTEGINGVDLVLKNNIGPIDFSVQTYFGSEDFDLSLNGNESTVEIRNQYGLVLNAEYDWLTLRASHHTSEVNFDGLLNASLPEPLGSLQGLATTLRMLPAELAGTGAAIAADRIEEVDVTYTFDEAAFKIDWNNLLVVGEIIKLTPDGGVFADWTRTLLSVGYTFGPIMLHGTHAKSADDLVNLSNGINNIPSITDGLILAVDGYAAGFGSEDRKVNTVGIRWDFEPGAAFKFELSDVSDDAGVDGTLTRFAIDLVF